MIILIGIAICVIFMFLVELDKAKYKKLKDASETNFLELKYKHRNPQNKVHFYIARDKDGILALWLGKPHRGKYIWTSKGNKMLMAADIELNLYGLNIDDYKDLKWEDEPVEVFLNLKD